MFKCANICFWDFFNINFFIFLVSISIFILSFGSTKDDKVPPQGLNVGPRVWELSAALSLLLWSSNLLGLSDRSNSRLWQPAITYILLIEMLSERVSGPDSGTRLIWMALPVKNEGVTARFTRLVINHQVKLLQTGLFLL